MFGTDFKGMLWHSGIDIKDARAILAISPGVGFLQAVVPAFEIRKNQEELLGFKWYLMDQIGGKNGKKITR